MSNPPDLAHGRSVVREVEFNVLGPVTVVEGIQPLNIGGPKQRTVLAMLIAQIGRPVSNEVIAEAVYGDDAPVRGRRRVQTYVSTLRSILGDVIRKEGRGWSLRVDRSQVDALRFEDLYESVRSDEDMSPEAASQIAREALALWRGHPYADIESHGFLDSEITRLGELRVAVHAARIDADLASGRHADLIGEIEALTVEHPYFERFRAQLMLALYRAGRQSEALRSYGQMRTLLANELGVNPSPELQDLEQRILEQDSSLELPPRSLIQKRAVLVADPGDPIELARLPATDRENLLGSASGALHKAVAESGGSLFPAGTASYAIFDGVVEAAVAAEKVGLRLDGPGMRMAIDYGDIEASDAGVSGAVVSRAAVLVAVAHPGQVLLSSDAQQAFITDGEGSGLRFESLGRLDLSGIEDPVSIYQLLLGDPPATFPPLDTDRVPPPLPDGGGRPLPGYELRDALGVGSVGTLYRGYQPSVGREVIIEVIGRAEAAVPDFIRNFEADAQRLALLDHPNINPVLDYWRDPEGAFLVYRFHRGGFLDGETVPNPQRLLEQVGSALEYAHSYGVVHGSVRPDRIALDESGNGYLMGFPVAGVAPQASPDHAAYIAPEVFSGNAPSIATDVFALGVLAHVLLSGEQVAADEAIRPDSLVIARAISEDPADRHESVADFLRELSPDEAPGERLTVARNPYKGLAPFHERDAGDFYGRAQVADELVSVLAGSRLLAVVGPSGIGKSSVVRAGLIPRLKAGALPDSDQWVITDMLPGSHPFLELERALERVAVLIPPDLKELLIDHDPNSLACLGRTLPSGTELLLVVDQFEELFTMTDATTARAFLNLLVTAIKNNQIRIVITLRADFLDRPLLYSEFGELLVDALVTLRSPSPTELREAISQPAAGAGVGVHEGLVERMISDVHDQPGALPLLQHALVELFDTRTSNLLSLDAYDDIGGVRGSLARRAETTYLGLDSLQQAATKQLFLRLVTVMEEGPPIRRRQRIGELDDLGAEPAIQAFARNRMLVFDNDPDTRAPTIEVAHEALFTQWPRLAGWIEGAREDLALSRRLEEAVTEWEANERDPAYLLTGGRLAQHHTWTSATSLALTPRIEGFLDASAVREQHVEARSRRRRRAIMTGFAAAALVASVIGLVALNNAERADAEATEAERQAEIAKSRELAAAAISVLEESPELSMMLALESVRAVSASDDVSPSGVIALREALASNRLLARIPLGSATASRLSSDGTTIFYTSQAERTVTAKRIETGETLWEYHDPTTSDDFSQIGLSPDDRLVAVPVIDPPGTEDDGHPTRLVILQASDGEVVRVLPSGGCSQGMGLIDNGFSPDGRWLAISNGSEQCRQPGSPEADWISVYATSTWEEIHRVQVDGGIFEGLSFSADSSRVVLYAGESTGGGGAMMTEVRSFPELDLIATLEGGWPATISPDGRTVVLLLFRTPERRPVLMDADTGERIAFLDAVDDFWVAYDSPGYSPDGSKIVVTTRATDYVFDAVTGRLLAPLGQTGNTRSHTFTADGTRLLTSTDTAAFLWDISTDVGLPIDPPDIDASWINPNKVLDGPNLAVEALSADGVEIISVLDPDTLEVTAYITGPGVQVPDGRFVVARLETVDDGMDRVLGPIVVWDPSSGETTQLTDCSALASELDGTNEVECPRGERFYGFASQVEAWSGNLVVGQAGSYFAATSYNPGKLPGLVRVWNTENLSIRSEFEIPRDYSPIAGGRAWLAYQGARPGGVGERILITDIDTGSTIATLTEYGGFAVTTQSLDGSLLFAADRTGRLLVLNTSTWEQVAAWQAHDAMIRGLAMSADGTRLVTTGNDNFVKVWEITGVRAHSISQPPPLLDRIPAPTPSDATWVGDEELIVFLADEAKWMRVSLDVADVVNEARALLTRGFTAVECATYQVDPCSTLEQLQDG